MSEKIYGGDEIDMYAVCSYSKDEHIKTLVAKVKDYESSHRGACFTCEPVGELNKKLEAQLEVLTKCYCAGDRLIGPTCNGCKNKKLLEGVKGEN